MNKKLTFIGFIALVFVLALSTCNKEDDSQQNTDEGTIANSKKIAQAVVHCSAIGLGEVLKQFADSVQKVEFIRQYIDSIRFYDDTSGYFYVYNFSCVNIAHATQKDLQGQNLYNYQDSHGNYVIRELAAAAEKGGDFVEYYWVKPGSAGEQRKIGYVEPIKDTDFFIGTGVYLTE
jgi:signal transduction histidine kinase